MFLNPNFAILVNFEIPKLFLKISGNFLVRRYEVNAISDDIN